MIHYISYVQIDAIKEGKARIEGYNNDGTAIVVEEEGHIVRPGSAWNIPSHNLWNIWFRNFGRNYR